MEALIGVTVTASTDKTGGAEGADWVETHGLDVAKDYFDKEKIAAGQRRSFRCRYPSQPASLGSQLAMFNWR